MKVWLHYKFKLQYKFSKLLSILAYYSYTFETFCTIWHQIAQRITFTKKNFQSNFVTSKVTFKDFDYKCRTATLHNNNLKIFIFGERLIISASKYMGLSEYGNHGVQKNRSTQILRARKT